MTQWRREARALLALLALSLVVPAATEQFAAVSHSHRRLEEGAGSATSPVVALLALIYVIFFVLGVVGYVQDRLDAGKATVHPTVVTSYSIEEKHVYTQAAQRYDSAAKLYEEMFGKHCPQAVEARAKQNEALEAIRKLDQKEPPSEDFTGRTWPDIFHVDSSNLTNRLLQLKSEMMKRHQWFNVATHYSSNRTRPHRLLSILCGILGIMFINANTFSSYEKSCTRFFTDETCPLSCVWDTMNESCEDPEGIPEIGPTGVIGAAIGASVIGFLFLGSMMSRTVNAIAVSKASRAKWGQRLRLEATTNATYQRDNQPPASLLAELFPQYPMLDKVWTYLFPQVYSV
jgi:hypothetical protein